MNASTRLSALFLIAALAGCATTQDRSSAAPENEKPKPTLVPQADPVAPPPARLTDTRVAKVFVRKAERRLELLNALGETIKSYRISLGYNPIGDKKCRGDRRTPEGDYTITGRNPKSGYFLSLRISYPSATDKKEASSRCAGGAGGDIFIHGRPNDAGPSDTWHSLRNDWTHGCIALPNKDIAEIYRTVRNGTPITIQP